MTKNEFFRTLSAAIGGLPKAERRKMLDYYEEIFDDKLESGMNEFDIIAEFGGVAGLKYKILADYPEAVRSVSMTNRVLSIIGMCFLTPFVFAMMVTLFALNFAFFAAGGCMVLAGLLYIPFSIPVFAASGVVGFYQIGACLFIAGLGTFILFGALSFLRLTIRIMKNTFGFYARVFGEGVRV